jgi:peptide-methionine (S)-S-oxide reductase
MHDPTTLNRQGNDVGDEYRSVIFYENDEQAKTAKDVTENYAADLWKDPIVTEVIPLKKFWQADAYMQNYYNNNPSAGYCMVIIDPKISKLRSKFAAKLKSEA